MISIKLLLILLLLVGCKDNDTLKQIDYNKEVKLKIRIEGALNKPGTYLVDKNTKINDLIKKEGGYKRNALKIKDNKITKNMQLFINTSRIKDKININEASNNELTKIKGIGPSIANKIIDYRSKYGNFKIESDIMKIKGIKEKLFNKIYEYIKI